MYVPVVVVLRLEAGVYVSPLLLVSRAPALAVELLPKRVPAEALELAERAKLESELERCVVVCEALR